MPGLLCLFVDANEVEEHGLELGVRHGLYWKHSRTIKVTVVYGLIERVVASKLLGTQTIKKIMYDQYK